VFATTSSGNEHFPSSFLGKARKSREKKRGGETPARRTRNWGANLGQVGWLGRKEKLSSRGKGTSARRKYAKEDVKLFSEGLRRVRQQRFILMGPTSGKKATFSSNGRKGKRKTFPSGPKGSHLYVVYLKLLRGDAWGKKTGPVRSRRQ